MGRLLSDTFAGAINLTRKEPPYVYGVYDLRTCTLSQP